MRETVQTPYVGATGRLCERELARLPSSRWALQPKVDGAYCRLVLGARGEVTQVLGRTGRPLSSGQGLLGCVVGAPHAELVGELEAHTEAGLRAAARRGFAIMHAFDCLLDEGGRSLVSEPYRVRRAALWRMHSALVAEDNDRLPVDASGRVHGPDGRFACTAPRGWRRVEIVPQFAPVRADELLAQVHALELEGVVAVALDAPAGRRGSKRKCRPVTTLDAVCLRAGERRVVCEWRGHIFAATAPQGLSCEPGQSLEVAHSGWYERSVTPRFARILRPRPDLH